MRALTLFLLGLALTLTLAIAQTRTSKTLDIYVVDVEGGNATLFVAPSGESVLIDTGNAGGTTGRDSGRILAAIKDSGIQQIDHLITTVLARRTRPKTDPLKITLANWSPTIEWSTMVPCALSGCSCWG